MIMTLNINELRTPSSSTVLNPKTNHLASSGLKRTTTLGFAVMLFSASFSTGIDYPSAFQNESSSIISYKDMTNNIYDISILHDFISNILKNSIDIDNDIVDMVNENFWDLI